MFSSYLSQWKEFPESVFTPFLFNPLDLKDWSAFEQLCMDSHIHISDTYQAQRDELLIVDNPTLLTKDVEHRSQVATGSHEYMKEGLWAYYPWRQTVVHILKQYEYQRVRLSRNKNLITETEQEVISDAHVAIAGLNVGNPAAVGLVLAGVGKRFSLADLDVLSLSNLNRFRSSLCDLDLNKSVLSARQMTEINPYLEIKSYAHGIIQDSIETFLNEDIDILIEEIDALELKLRLRQHARVLQIPVVMVTGNGSGVILDIERYDLESELPTLNGYLSRSVSERLLIDQHPLSMKEHLQLAQDFIGKEWLTDRLLTSFRDVGETLAGIPQLAETTQLRGAVLTHIVRSILSGSYVPSGRYSVQLHDIIS